MSINNLEKKIATYAMNCSEKLRKQKSSAKAITVFIQTNRFKKQQRNFSKSIFFETPTNDSFELVKNAIKLLFTIYDSGFQYKSAGVIVSKIIFIGKNMYGLVYQSKIFINGFEYSIPSKYGNTLYKK